MPWGEPCESPPGLADPQFLPHGALQTGLPRPPQHQVPLEQHHMGRNESPSGRTPAWCHLPVPLLGQLLTCWVFQRDDVSLALFEMTTGSSIGLHVFSHKGS